MHSNRIGYLGYKLYRLGWQNSLYGDCASLKHIFLSVFFHYRRGFTSAAEWAEEYRPQEKLYL